MNEKCTHRIFWWFVAFVLLLCIQFCVAISLQEPYPAILFPSFDKIPSGQPSFTKYEFQVHVDEAMIEVPAQKVFHRLRPSHVNGALRRLPMLKSQKKRELQQLHAYIFERLDDELPHFPLIHCDKITLTALVDTFDEGMNELIQTDTTWHEVVWTK